MTDRKEDARTAFKGDESLPDAITQSPDRRHIRERRAKLGGWRRRVYDYLVVPAEIPSEFNQSLSTLASELATSDESTAAATLAEAQAIFDETSDRIASAERRATTMQGTVAIAASLVVAGAGLFADTSKIPDRAWRTAFEALLAVFVVSLIGTAWRALAVTGRMFEFEQPGPDRIFLRAKKTGVEARTFRAAELLRAAGVASEIGAVKVGLLRSAGWWLRIAVIILTGFVISLVTYVATSHNSNATPTQGHHLHTGSR